MSFVLGDHVRSLATHYDAGTEDDNGLTFSQRQLAAGRLCLFLVLSCLGLYCLVLHAHEHAFKQSQLFKGMLMRMQTKATQHKTRQVVSSQDDTGQDKTKPSFSNTIVIPVSTLTGNGAWCYGRVSFVYAAKGRQQRCYRVKWDDGTSASMKVGEVRFNCLFFLSFSNLPVIFI